MTRCLICVLICTALAGCAAPGPPAPVGDSRRPASPATAPEGPARVEYEITLDQARSQMIGVAIRVPDLEQDSVEFVLPTWRPGRYAILDPAGSVREVLALGDGDEPLDARKTDKTTWRVDCRGRSAVTLTYRVYANSLGDRTRHADDTHAFVSPSSVLMFVPERRAEPATVSVAAPEGWGVATGLEPAPGRPGVFTAASYDVLADSPLEIGVHERIGFDMDGIPHEVAIWGRTNHSRHDFPGDLARIIRAQRDIFGGLPYSRYIFIIHSAPGARGATEHLNSTILQAGPASFDTAKAYRGLLGLASHEFFHTWNIKQFRPAGLSPYDYIHENYTTSLWIAEGTTSYYAPLTLARTGLLEPKDYLSQLAEAAGALLNRPGRHLQSLEESSFDAWIKFSRSTPDSVNSTVSFYDKGALVSLLLDLEIRRRTGGAASLDEVMRAMYESFPLDGPGYAAADFQVIVERIAGGSLDDFFADFVAGTAELPLAEALRGVGLELAFEPDKEAVKDGRPDPAAYIGLDLAERNGLAAVEAVRADGPAYSAGVNAGDEIIALNGIRLRAGDLEARLGLLNPGDTIRLTLLRRDEVREFEFAAGARRRGSWKLARAAEPTEGQRAAYESWLKQPWPGPDEEQKQEPADAPRPHEEN